MMKSPLLLVSLFLGLVFSSFSQAALLPMPEKTLPGRDKSVTIITQLVAR